MRVLSLFSGIGGIDLGLERAGMTVVAQCEADPFCRAVLAKHWPEVSCFDDVRTLAGSDVRDVDLVAGGFPCQDVSSAGKGAGIGGARSGLWREMARLIAECRPRWCLIENVPALRSRGADRVLADLEALGYDAWPLVVGAWAVGAPHRRNRVWIVALAVRGGLEGRSIPSRSRNEGERASRAFRTGSGTSVADTHCGGRRIDGSALCELGREARAATLGGSEGRTLADATGVGVEGHRPEGIEEPEVPAREGLPRRDGGGARWPDRPGEQQHPWEEPRLVEFPMGGSVAGIPVRLVRTANRNALRAYGNAVVPQVVEAIGRAIVAEERTLNASL